MKQLLFALVLAGSCTGSSFAMWAAVPVDELIQDSDLIIVGTLSGVSEYTSDDVDYGEGTILVEDVIWGDVSLGESLALRWKNGSFVACPRIEHKHAENKRAIWILTTGPGGEVRADYPGRFVELSD